jgi:phosphoglycolate phosphatase
MTRTTDLRYPVAIVDFDGTVSLIREGWARIMAELGRDVLRSQSFTGEPESVLIPYLEEQMLRLSGRPSLVQMQKLNEEIRSRGAESPTPESLHDEFMRRLYAQIEQRKHDLASGAVSPDDWTVPGTRAFLHSLRHRGVQLYLVSGTDRAAVVEESALLQLTDFFGARVYAPDEKTPDFHKRSAIAEILKDHGISGERLLGFGDGFSETVEVKRVGGRAVGVASVEVGQRGMNERKRELLTEWGAEPIVPDYRETEKLIARIYDE